MRNAIAGVLLFLLVPVLSALLGALFVICLFARPSPRKPRPHR